MKTDELDFVFPLFTLYSFPLHDFLFKGLLFGEELNFFPLKLSVEFAVFLFFLFEFVHSFFGLELFLHAEIDRRLIEGLVGCKGHFVLVSNSHEEQAAFWAIDGDLADDFVEGLAEELLTDGTDSLLPGLAIVEFVVEGLLQAHDFVSGALLVRDVLHKELAFLADPVSRRNHVIEDICVEPGVPSGLGLGSSTF